jgi:hypothetical protein
MAIARANDGLHDIMQRVAAAEARYDAAFRECIPHGEVPFVASQRISALTNRIRAAHDEARAKLDQWRDGQALEHSVVEAYERLLELVEQFTQEVCGR